MEFTKSLIKGKLIKRYKRFFVDVKLDKEIVTAHCPNTGSMKGLLEEGNDAYLLKHEDPKRKLKYGLEIIKAQKNLVPNVLWLQLTQRKMEISGKYSLMEAEIILELMY